MKVELIPASQLAPAQVRTWSELQRADPTLDSPFFRPEFTQAVAACRDDVEVAILEQDGAVVGFFPFQRGAWNVGKPVGGRLSDFHGVIARREVQFDAHALMRECRLAAWDFHNLIASQQPFAPYHWAELPSPYIDVSQGFDAYYQEQVRRRTYALRSSLRCCRKLDREVGPLRYVHHTTEPALLDQFIAWKSMQYQRTKVTNIFKYDWTVRLLKRLLGHPTDEFSVMFSSLYAGDQLLAVEFNLRSRDVLHGWFPAYDTNFASYSPGTCLIVQIAKAAEYLGIRRIDMCSGPAKYKEWLMSGSIPMARGTVACSLPARLLRTSWRQTNSLLQTAPLRIPKRIAGRVTRPLRSWLAFR